MRSPLVKIYLGGDAGKEISTWVSKFSFDDTLNKDSKLTLSIFQENVMDLLDEKAILTKGEIFFQFGYMESPMSEIHRAKIVNVDVDYGKTINVTVTCMDKGNVMKKSSETTVWKNQTTKDIARQIALRYNMELEMSYEGKLWKSLPQGNRSDFELLQYIVAREEGGKFRVFIRNNTLYIAERGLSKNSVRTFTYRGDENTQSFKVTWKESSADSSAAEKVAIKDAGSDATKGRVLIGTSEYGTKAGILGVEEGGLIAEIEHFLWDVGVATAPPTKETATDGYDQGGYRTLRGQEGVDWRHKEDPIGKNVVTSVADPSEAKDTAAGVMNKAALKVMTATLTIEGDPLIRPDTVITMAGVHKSHAGNWYVHGVNQDITGHVYVTVLDLARNKQNGVGGVSTETKNKTVGPDTQEEPRIQVGIIDGLGKEFSKQYQDYSSKL